MAQSREPEVGHAQTRRMPCHELHLKSHLAPWGQRPLEQPDQAPEERNKRANQDSGARPYKDLLEQLAFVNVYTHERLVFHGTSPDRDQALSSQDVER